jgi:hypothetical protein
MQPRTTRIADTMLALGGGLVGLFVGYVGALVPCFDGVAGPYCNVHGYAPGVAGALSLITAVVGFVWVKRMLKSSDRQGS